MFEISYIRKGRKIRRSFGNLSDARKSAIRTLKRVSVIGNKVDIIGKTESGYHIQGEVVDIHRYVHGAKIGLYWYYQGSFRWVIDDDGKLISETKERI